MSSPRTPSSPFDVLTANEISMPHAENPFYEVVDANHPILSEAPSDLLGLYCSYLSLSDIHSLFSVCMRTRSSLMAANSPLAFMLFNLSIKEVVCARPHLKPLVYSFVDVPSATVHYFPAYASVLSLGKLLGVWAWPSAVRGGCLSVAVSEGGDAVEGVVFEPRIGLRSYDIGHNHLVPFEGATGFQVDVIFKIPITPGESMLRWQFAGKKGFVGGDDDSASSSSSSSASFVATLTKLYGGSNGTRRPSSDASTPLAPDSETPRLRLVKNDRRSLYEDEVALPSASDTLSIIYPASPKYDGCRWLRRVLNWSPPGDGRSLHPEPGARFGGAKTPNRAGKPFICDRICDAMHPSKEMLDGRLKTLFGVDFMPAMYSGAYGPHGVELIDVRLNHDGDGLVGLKISGDPNVPAGKTTFKTLGRFKHASSFEKSYDPFVCACEHQCACPRGARVGLRGEKLLNVIGEFSIRVKTAATNYVTPLYSAGKLVMFKDDRRTKPDETLLLVVFLEVIKTSILMSPVDFKALYDEAVAKGNGTGLP